MMLLLLQRYWMRPEIPRIILLPLGLAFLVLVQYMLGRIIYFDQALLYVFYLIWAALLIMLGRCLRQEFELPVLITVIAVSLLFGAEVNALFGVLQHYHWHTFLDPLIAAKTSVAVFGNLGQPNHYANYITLGLISLGMLHTRFSLRAWQVLLFAAPLLFVLVLTGSRSAWLYLISMVALAFLWHRRDKSNLLLLRYSLSVIAGFALMHLIMQIPFLAGVDGTVTTIQRLVGANSGSLRLYVWRESWIIFSQFPLLGAGFGQFDWQHFLLTEQLRDINIAGLYNNAHNLVLHIAAEMGLAGLLMLLGTLALWLRQALRTGERNPYHWWGYSVLMLLGIHSLLEYPLWYTYFLGPAALVLGMLDTTTYSLQLRRLGSVMVGALLILGFVLVFHTLQSYRKMEAAVTRLVSLPKNSAYDWDVREGLRALYNQALMVSVVEPYVANMLALNTERLPNKLALNERVMRASPTGPAVYRQAVLLALAGEKAAAELQMRRAIWSYPADFEMIRQKIGELALYDPAHFTSLLEFSDQVYEEWKSAVRAR